MLRPGLLLLLVALCRVGAAIPAERVYEAVTVILSYQNSDGGMATYENTRSFHWLEVSQANKQTNSATTSKLAVGYGRGRVRKARCLAPYPCRVS